MTTTDEISLKCQQAAGPDPAAALALVAAIVLLPKPTLAALRLTCKDTKRFVDQDVTELDISFTAAEGLRVQGNLLTSGLTSLRIRKDDDLYLSSGAQLVLSNHSTLETLKIEAPVRAEALTALGTRTYPRLRSLSIFASLGIFITFPSPDSTPRLDELHITTLQEPLDNAALSNAQQLCSTVEILEIKFKLATFQPHGRLQSLLKHLIPGCPNLRRLNLGIGQFSTMDFLTDAELPCLEYLKVDLMNFSDTLYPIVATPKPHLHTLVLDGIDGFGTSAEEKLAPLFTAPAALPALENLVLEDVSFFENFQWIAEIKLNTIRNLVIRGCWSPFHEDDAIAGAAGLASLPHLESLEITPYEYQYTDGMGHDSRPTEGYLALGALLSAGALPDLRRLTTGGWWEDSDDSIDSLIDNADKVPLLEEIVMKSGAISSDGFEALASAGKQRLWPSLRVFHIKEFVVMDEDFDLEFCCAMLREVWPDLEIKIGENA